MNIWNYLLNKLSTGDVLLLLVVQSEGSSPGRQGFKMAVASDGSFYGTIGGGIMEYKLVEKAKELLKTGVNSVSLVEQYHDKEHAKNQSGMICSGKQTIAFLPLKSSDIELVRSIANAAEMQSDSGIMIGRNGLVFINEATRTNFINEKDWSYSESLKQRQTIHIIGGGHVSLALSELMHYLDFHVKVYDDRPDLSTIAENHFADESILVDYDRICDFMKASPSDHVVIMTVGYRDDLRVFRQLIGKEFFYLGMLGSESKIDALFERLSEEGIERSALSGYFIPVGLNIYSKTPKEIAVSIAAQIILEKNKHQSTGRKSKPAMHES